MKKLILILALGFAFFSWQLAPNYVVSGYVLDEAGEALIGASVLEKGTTNGTITNINGYFELKVGKPTVQLVVSYTGFDTKELKKVKAGEEQKIVLNGGAELEEVVVTGNAKGRRKVRKEAKMAAPAMGITTYEMNSMAAPMPAADYEDVQQFNTEDYGLINENRFLGATENPLSTFSIDVDAASYSNMRRFIQNGQKPPIDAVRIEELVNYFNYEYQEPKQVHPFEIITEVSACPWDSEHQLVHIGLQGKRIKTENLPASNLVFLIDVSGSMNSPNKLPLLKSSFRLLVNKLRPQDRVAMVVYAGAAGVVLPSTSGSDKEKMLKALDQLSAGGSTAGGAGIKLAYEIARKNFVKGGNNRVILATDGDFNIGASSDAALVRMIEKERESDVFLTVLGFGMGNYKDNKMQQLANKGNGNHAYIDNIREAKKVLVEEFGGTMFTIAKDVKIQIEFNPQKVQSYRLIGYENRLLNKEDFNDDKKDAGELGAGHTVTALYEVIPTGVDNKYTADVDDLKYQKTPKQSEKGGIADELLTVKLRYKQPTGKTSQKLEEVVLNKAAALDKSTDNFRWAAAVAEFGMLLRDSEFKGKSSYAKALSLAKGAKGKDPNGYRQELIEMIETMNALEGAGVAENK